MVSRRRGALLAFAFSLGIAFFGAKQACGQQTKYKVPEYEDGGTFRVTLDVPAVQKVKMSGEIDSFIWDHWSQRRRGKLQIIGQTIEGQVKVQKIFIEADDRGHWHIRDEEEADVHKGTQPAPARSLDVYDEVRRIDIDSGQAIPASQKRTPGTYHLLLINTSKGAQWVL